MRFGILIAAIALFTVPQDLGLLSPDRDADRHGGIGAKRHIESREDKSFVASLVPPPVILAPKNADAPNKPGATFLYQQDAPSCSDCGAIMVRNGACYKCLNCGTTSGCS